MTRLTTPRLVLREWTDADVAPFAAMNADPVVQRYYPSVLSFEESAQRAARIRARFDETGPVRWGLWVAEHEGAFIGYIGLARPNFTAPFMPCVEFAWKLAAHAHGKGLATEGALAVKAFALEHLRHETLVAGDGEAGHGARRGGRLRSPLAAGRAPAAAARALPARALSHGPNSDHRGATENAA